MNSALLILEQPVREQQDAYRQWEHAAQNLGTASKECPQIEVPTSGCAIVDLAAGPRPLLKALQAVERANYRVLFFEKPPQWVRTLKPTGKD